MYPSIADLLNDLFGTSLKLPIQTFGFMMAIAFLCAAWTLAMELKRKENQGLLKPIDVKYMKGDPASISDMISSGLFGFIFGWKFVYGALNYGELVDNPQEVMLSMKGNLPAGLLFGGIMAYLRYREKEKERLPQPIEVTEVVHPFQLVANVTMIAAISGILGSKLFHILENLDSFYEDPMGNILSFSGLTFYGGLICGAISVLWYTSKNKIPNLMMIDAAAPGLILSYGVGRIGCQLSGDGDWGTANIAPKPGWLNWAPDWMWSFSYPHNVVGEGVPIPGCEGKFCNQLVPPVFPTPFYEAVACILLFFFLWSIRKKINTPGILFGVYLIVNGLERFTIEQIRINNKMHFAGLTFTQAELIAVILILTGVLGIFILNKRNKKNTHQQII